MNLHHYSIIIIHPKKKTSATKSKDKVKYDILNTDFLQPRFLAEYIMYGNKTTRTIKSLINKSKWQDSPLKACFPSLQRDQLHQGLQLRQRRPGLLTSGSWSSD